MVPALTVAVPADRLEHLVQVGHQPVQVGHRAGDALVRMAAAVPAVAGTAAGPRARAVRTTTARARRVAPKAALVPHALKVRAGPDALQPLVALSVARSVVLTTVAPGAPARVGPLASVGTVPGAMAAAGMASAAAIDRRRRVGLGPGETGQASHAASGHVGPARAPHGETLVRIPVSSGRVPAGPTGLVQRATGSTAADRIVVAPRVVGPSAAVSTGAAPAPVVPRTVAPSVVRHVALASR